MLGYGVTIGGSAGVQTSFTTSGPVSPYSSAGSSMAVGMKPAAATSADSLSVQAIPALSCDSTPARLGLCSVPPHSFTARGLLATLGPLTFEGSYEFFLSGSFRNGEPGVDLSASGSIDPVVEIDPASGLDPSQVQIRLNSGVANATPEP